MLRMTALGLLQTAFFAFILKTYLNLSWQTVTLILLAIIAVLLFRVKQLVR